MNEGRFRTAAEHPGVAQYSESFGKGASLPEPFVFLELRGLPDVLDGPNAGSWLRRFEATLVRPVQARLKQFGAVTYSTSIAEGSARSRRTTIARVASSDQISGTVTTLLRAELGQGRERSLHLVFMPELGFARVAMSAFDDVVPWSKGLQGSLVDLLVSGANDLEAKQGFITLDRVAHQSAHEAWLGRRGRFDPDGALEHLAGYQWGTLLTSSLVDDFGGADSLRTGAPVHSSSQTDLAREKVAVFLQLTPDLRDWPDRELFKLRQYLKPHLLPGPPRGSYFGPPIRFLMDEEELVLAHRMAGRDQGGVPH